jgi:Family of unknown function (DUF6527)
MVIGRKIKRTQPVGANLAPSAPIVRRTIDPNIPPAHPGSEPEGARVRLLGVNLLSFHCPGCGYGHAVGVNGRTILNSAGEPVSWTWNGDFIKPTFKPSLLINKDNHPSYPRCHTFITDGQINFLADCTHHLKGKIVDMEIDE